MVISILVIGFLSFIVWGHHMFMTGMNPFLGSVFTFTTLLIAIPSAVKVSMSARRKKVRPKKKKSFGKNKKK